MSGAPPGSGGCCVPRSQGITYLKLGPRRVTVGMLGLEEVFQQLAAMGRRPEETSDEELVGMARSMNWIPENATAEGHYATALREAYTDFTSRREKRPGQA